MHKRCRCTSSHICWLKLFGYFFFFLVRLQASKQRQRRRDKGYSRTLSPLPKETESFSVMLEYIYIMCLYVCVWSTQLWWWYTKVTEDGTISVTTAGKVRHTFFFYKRKNNEIKKKLLCHCYCSVTNILGNLLPHTMNWTILNNNLKERWRGREIILVVETRGQRVYHVCHLFQKPIVTACFVVSCFCSFHIDYCL